MATLPEAIGAFISDAVTVASKAAGAMPSAGEKRRTETEFGYSTLLPYPAFSVRSKTPRRLDLQHRGELGDDLWPRIARGLLQLAQRCG